MTQNLFRPKKIFRRKKFFRPKKKFENKKLSTQKIFLTKMVFFEQKKFLPKKLLPKTFLTQNIFSTQQIFLHRPKMFFQAIKFLTKRIAYFESALTELGTTQSQLVLIGIIHKKMECLLKLNLKTFKFQLVNK